MAKIMLVEDDNNLREIYEARLQAEGYTIVAAKDGEEALVLAKAENPDLVISDVMMPKISGFEMLDILRNTESTKHVKVIMLTALGQNDDQQRADRLGADRYLVKSQVTLEDIVNVAHQLLEGDGSLPVVPANPGRPTNTPVPDPVAAAPALSEPVVVAPAPVLETVKASPDPVSAAPPAVTEPIATPPADTSAASSDDQLISDAVTSLAASAAASEEAATTIPNPPSVALSTSNEPEVASVIDASPQPITAPEADPILIDSAAVAVPTVETSLLDSAVTPAPSSASEEAHADAQTTAGEEAELEAQIENFVSGASTEPTTPDTLLLAAEPAEPVIMAPEPTTVGIPAPEPIAPVDTQVEPISASAYGAVNVAGKKVISPMIDGEPKSDLNALLAAEIAKEEQATATVFSPTPVAAAPALATPPVVSPTPAPADGDPSNISL